MPSQLPGSTAPGPEPPLATYAHVAHVARVYDYLLGGKDTISQVVPAVPYSDRMLVIQARQ